MTMIQLFKNKVLWINLKKILWKTASLHTALGITYFPYSLSIHNLLAVRKSITDMKPTIPYGFYSEKNFGHFYEAIWGLVLKWDS